MTMFRLLHITTSYVIIYIVEKEHRLNTSFIDYPFGEGHIEKPPKSEFITLRMQEDVNNYTDYKYDKPNLKMPIPNKEKLSLNISPLLLEDDIGKEQNIDFLVNEFMLLQDKNIEPKFELLSRPLGKLTIQDFTQKPQIKHNKYMSSSSSSLLGVENAQQLSSGYPDLGAIKPEDLPEIALPILEFLEDVQPHIVIGCDRGGRLFGLAMHAAWRRTRDGQPFPTLDGKLYFARVSMSEDRDILQGKIDGIVEASKQLGKQRGNEVADGEKLRVLFVDDWVIGGSTLRLAHRLMEKHNSQTYFAVMCGEGADATGKRDLQTHVNWHDKPEEIGVNYLSTLELNPDGTVTQNQEVIAVRTAEAVRNRQRIQEAARKLVPVRVLAETA